MATILSGSTSQLGYPTRDGHYFDSVAETWVTFPDILDTARYSQAAFIVSRDICVKSK